MVNEKFNILLRAKDSVLAAVCGVLSFLPSCVSEEEYKEKYLEEHCGEFVHSEFTPIDVKTASKDEIVEVFCETAAKEMAADVDSLLNYTLNPMNKYKLETNFCTAGVTFAIRDAQKRMKLGKNLDVFKGMKPDGMTNGNVLIKFFKDNYPEAIFVMKPEDEESKFDQVRPGTIVRYCGHYNDGKKHGHTQMFLGYGYNTSDCFAPHEDGQPVMGASYAKGFKSYYEDMQKYGSNDGEEKRPLLDSIILIDVSKVLEKKLEKTK